jgi:uncharacterized protein (TIGR03067 family)
MQVPMVIIMAASLLTVPDKSPKKDPVKAELKKLEGTWKLVSLESRGRKYDADFFQQINYRLTLKGTTYSLEMRGRKGTVATIKVDPKQKPKTLDLAVTEGIQKGRTILAIYSLEGDTLTICQTVPGKKRPTAFAAPAGSSEALFTLKKEKP